MLLVCGLSQRQASQACGIGRATVAEYLVRARRAGVLERAWESWSGEGGRPCEIAWYGGLRALSVARCNAPRFLD